MNCFGVIISELRKYDNNFLSEERASESEKLDELIVSISIEMRKNGKYHFCKHFGCSKMKDNDNEYYCRNHNNCKIQWCSKTPGVSGYCNDHKCAYDDCGEMAKDEGCTSVYCDNCIKLSED